MKPVTTIYPSNFREPAATLRVIADQIEAGEFGSVGCAALVLLGEKLEVFGMGPDSESPSVHYLLCSGAARLVSGALEHGRDP